MYGVCVVGREDSIRERFYAISVEKRLKPPAVVAVTRAARQALFAGRLRDGSQPRRRPHRTYGTWRPGGRGPAARRGAAQKNGGDRLTGGRNSLNSLPDNDSQYQGCRDQSGISRRP
jgi:hypothetical protein